MKYVNAVVKDDVRMYVCQTHGTLHWCKDATGSCCLEEVPHDGMAVCRMTNNSFKSFSYHYRHPHDSNGKKPLLIRAKDTNPRHGAASILETEEDPILFCQLVRAELAGKIEVDDEVLTRIFAVLKDESSNGGCKEFLDLTTEMLIGFVSLALTGYANRHMTMFYVPPNSCEQSVRNARSKDNMKKYVDTIVAECLSKPKIITHG